MSVKAHSVTKRPLERSDAGCTLFGSNRRRLGEDGVCVAPPAYPFDSGTTWPRLPAPGPLFSLADYEQATCVIP